MRLLDQGLLEALDRALTQHAPVVRACFARPGLSEDEIRAHFSELDLVPSAEALVWWSYWRLSPGDCAHASLFPKWEFVPLDAGVRAAEWWRDQAQEMGRTLPPPHTAEDVWSSDWMPVLVMGEGGFLVLDLATDPTGPTPVRASWPDSIDSPVTSSSLGELVASATAWIEEGKSKYDPARRSWWPLDALGRSFAAEERFATG